MDRLTAIMNRFSDGYWTSDSDDRDQLHSDLKYLITALECCLVALESVVESYNRSNSELIRTGMLPDNRQPIHVAKCRKALRKVEGM